MSITQIITALPEAPSPTDTQAEFDTKSFAHVAAQAGLVTELNTFGAQANALAADVAADAADVAAAVPVAEQAISLANFRGAWSGLTGALAVPASVGHGGKIYVLLSSVADVTAHTPGVSSVWQMTGADPLPISAPLTLAASGAVTLASTPGSSLSVLRCVAIDSSRDLLIVAGPSSMHAVVHDSTTATFGPAALIRTAAISAGVAAILCGTDKVLVASVPASTALETVVLSIAGTTISVGSAVSTTLAGNRKIESRCGFLAVGSSYLLSFRDETTSMVALRAIAVSGTTPAVGAELALSAHGFEDTLQSWEISASVALVITASNSTIFCTPVSVSGTTLTAGTQATSALSARAGICSTLLASGRVAVIWQNSTMRGGIISVSGTTATLSSVDTTLSVDTATDWGLCAIGSQAIVSNGGSGVNVLTDSAGTAVAGSALSVMALLFGYTASAVLGSQASHVYRVIGISGNNPVLQATYTLTLDSTATWAHYGQFSQGTGGLGITTLRTSAGKHAGVYVSGNDRPFAPMASGSGDVERVFAVPVFSTRARATDDVIWSVGMQASTTTLYFRKVKLS